MRNVLFATKIAIVFSFSFQLITLFRKNNCNGEYGTQREVSGQKFTFFLKIHMKNEYFTIPFSYILVRHVLVRIVLYLLFIQYTLNARRTAERKQKGECACVYV